MEIHNNHRNTSPIHTHPDKRQTSSRVLQITQTKKTKNLIKEINHTLTQRIHTHSLDVSPAKDTFSNGTSVPGEGAVELGWRVCIGAFLNNPVGAQPLPAKKRLLTLHLGYMSTNLFVDCGGQGPGEKMAGS